MNKKNKTQNKKRNAISQRLEAINKQNQKIEGLILTIIFFMFLAICQILGYIFDIDFLRFITVTRTSSSISFWLIPAGAVISYLIYKIFKKLSYMMILVDGMKKLHIWLKKYPRLYRIARFIYKHPICSYFIIWTIYTAIDILLYYVIKF